MECLQVAGRDVVFSHERLLSADNFIDASIGGEISLNGVERDDGTVCSSSAVVHRLEIRQYKW